MEVCANCGQPLGVGRFCTNCGHRAGEAPAQAGPPTPPPPATEPPPRARYPLFADDVPSHPPPTLPPAQTPTSAPTPAPTPAPVPQPVVPTADRPSRSIRSTGGWLPWAVGTVALLLFALIGALLLLGDDDDGGRGETASETSSESARGKPGRPRSPKPTEQPPAGEGPMDVAKYAGISVPDTAPPNVDVSGNPVRYGARNMIDKLPATCWRMPGSGEGDEIVFTFLEPVEISEVGIINGYAKSSGDLDWYDGNRRVLEVEWVFDDGTSVEQGLESTRDLQTLTFDAVTTTTVTLHLLDVSEPGTGRSARNYTAISDVSLVGEPA